MTDLLGSLFGGAWTWIAAAGVAILAIGGAYLKGRGAGKAKVEKAQLEDKVKDLETRDEVEDRNAAQPDSAVRDRLRDWQR